MAVRKNDILIKCFEHVHTHFISQVMEILKRYDSSNLVPTLSLHGLLQAAAQPSEQIRKRIEEDREVSRNDESLPKELLAGWTEKQINTTDYRRP